MSGREEGREVGRWRPVEYGRSVEHPGCVGEQRRRDQHGRPELVGEHEPVAGQPELRPGQAGRGLEERPEVGRWRPVEHGRSVQHPGCVGEQRRARQHRRPELVGEHEPDAGQPAELRPGQAGLEVGAEGLEAEAVRQARAEAVPEARAEAVPEARAEAVPEARAEAVPEARAEAVPKPEPAVPKPEPKPCNEQKPPCPPKPCEPKPCDVIVTIAGTVTHLI